MGSSSSKASKDPKLRPESKEITKQFPWQSFDEIQVGKSQVGKSIRTLHHLPEIDVLVIGCKDGSLLTVNNEGRQTKCAKKHVYVIACIRHHGDVIAVADISGKCWKCSERTFQLEFLRYLPKQVDPESTFDSRIDISSKYIASGRGKSLYGRLTVWRRKTEGDSSAPKNIAEHKFEKELHSILIHDNHVLCGMPKGHLVIYDPEEKSVLKKVIIGSSDIRSIVKSEDQIYLATYYTGIFCMNDKFEANMVIETTLLNQGSIHQIIAQGGNLYCSSEDGGLKCFSLASLAASYKKEVESLDWMEDGTAILEAGGDESDEEFVFEDRFQVSRSTLFVVPPEDADIVKIVRLP